MFAAPPRPYPRPVVTQTAWPAGRPPGAPPPRPAPQRSEPAWPEELIERPAPEEPGYGHGV